MDIEDTKKAIEVMQAYVDGKIIQCLVTGEWHDRTVWNTPTWNWAKHDYCIKPEPREIDIDESAKIVVSIQHKGKYVETLVIDGPCHFVEKLDD